MRNEAMKRSGRWLLGIVFLAVAPALVFFLLFNIHRQVTTQRSDLLVDYFYDQYTEQEEGESDAFDTQQITDAFQESSTYVEQLTNSRIKLTSQSEEVSENSAKLSHYSDGTQKSIEDEMIEAVQQAKTKLDDEIFSKFLHPLIISKISKTTRLEEKFVNLPTFPATITSATPTTRNISNATTVTTTRKYKKYKFNAYIKTFSGTHTELPKHLPENSNLANFPNATKVDALLTSKLIATDRILSYGRRTHSKMPIIREFSTFNNLTTSDPLLIKNNLKSDANQIAMQGTKFIKNLQNLRVTTISTSNLTTVSPHLQQENIVTIDKETETEVKDKEIEEKGDNYEYEDFLYVNSASTTSISTTTTLIATATTTISTTITIPKFTSGSQSHRHLHHHHHYHHQYDHYDRDSPIIVTALFDIGRGKWPRYTRTYEQYMNYLKHLLKLKNCLVIYTDPRGAELVRQTRDARNTQIFEMSMHDLPLYRYREEMKDIIRREQKDWRFSPKTRYHPEANSADYNIIVNSKPYFLYNATQNARFRTSDRMFVWIDAGYGHGRKGIIPDHCHWRPQLRRDRITIIQLTPMHDKLSRYSINDLYRVDWVVLSGGFIAGDSYTINRFYRFYQKSFMELLDSGRIDDDQTILTLMLKHYANLFNPLSSNGDWYAVFRLFPCNDRQ